jgi:hypothetical protein
VSDTSNTAPVGSGQEPPATGTPGQEPTATPPATPAGTPAPTGQAIVAQHLAAVASAAAGVTFMVLVAVASDAARHLIQ